VERDWQAEIDRWTERFRGVEDPPEPFATALREGWTAEAREALAAEAEAYASAQRTLLEQVGGAGMDLVRLDCRAGSCGVCARYCGKAFSLTGETEGLPPPPPMPICPACRHTLNLLTPFFMQSLGLDVEDLIDEAEPFAD
jgi:ferredoxin